MDEYEKSLRRLVFEVDYWKEILELGKEVINCVPVVADNAAKLVGWVDYTHPSIAELQLNAINTINENAKVILQKVEEIGRIADGRLHVIENTFHDLQGDSNE